MKVIAYDLLDLVSRAVDTVRDQGEFVVESIVDSSIDDMPKTNWQFKVRWAGYDESYDEWLD